MTDLEERIIAWIGEETGIKRTRVEPSSRLADDIGMDGDDAVEFFARFGEKFQVDLTTLHEHRHQHFFPEGFGAPSPGCIVAIGAAVLLGGLVHEAVRRIPAWAAMIALTAAFCWVYGRFFVERPQGKLPITVQDLVDAAVAGKWLKRYQESPPELFRSVP